MSPHSDDFAHDVRVHVFEQAAATGRVPQPEQIAASLRVPAEQVRGALLELAAAKVLILAPNSTNIWAANPFCAVPSGFRVDAAEKTYWGICIWDALGVVAAIRADTARVRAPCGDCGDPMTLEIHHDELVAGDGIVHFPIPARHWWDNIGFT